MRLVKAARLSQHDVRHVQERAMKGVLRVPEVLRVSPGVLEAKVDYYTGAGCGASTLYYINLIQS